MQTILSRTIVITALHRLAITGSAPQTFHTMMVISKEVKVYGKSGLICNNFILSIIKSSFALDTFLQCISLLFWNSVFSVCCHVQKRLILKN